MIFRNDAFATTNCRQTIHCIVWDARPFSLFEGVDAVCQIGGYVSMIFPFRDLARE